MRKSIIKIAVFIFGMILGAMPVQAVVDPLSTPNNRVGIHIISAVSEEASAAANLVNSSGGDWGYVTVLVESKDRNHDKWQAFFNQLRRRHLIPLVRLATQPENGLWKLPYEGEEIAWADFLDNLIWPTKNRYVIIYNEPNQGQEWAGQVNPKSYAQVLDKTIAALKNKNKDFFALNAGFDASAPQTLPNFQNELSFLQIMNETVPGIFNKLDGWVSHSYPNPGFAGSPDASGRGTIRTWEWELAVLKELGVTKQLPVFITETGWKHAEGLNFDKSLPSSKIVGKYLQKAFTQVWNNHQIVAVTPFLLNYQENPFDHFSFKRMVGKEQNEKILGAIFPDYYPQYQTVLDLSKTAGQPVQENQGELVKGTVYSSVVAGEKYIIPLTFKNTGQSIWNERGPVDIRSLSNNLGVTIDSIIPLPSDKIEPGQEITFKILVSARRSGAFPVKLQLFNDGRMFDQPPLEFTVNVKPAVILTVNAGLLWKSNFAGTYLLSASSDVINSIVPVTLNTAGQSEQIEAKYLLPDYTFNLTLSKLYYQPKTIQVKVVSGNNNLDFGVLKPDFLTALFNPKEFWKILPFSP